MIIHDNIFRESLGSFCNRESSGDSFWKHGKTPNNVFLKVYNQRKKLGNVWESWGK